MKLNPKSVSSVIDSFSSLAAAIHARDVKAYLDLLAHDIFQQLWTMHQCVGRELRLQCDGSAVGI
jgi:hypothetical protein